MPTPADTLPLGLGVVGALYASIGLFLSIVAPVLVHIIPFLRPLPPPPRIAVTRAPTRRSHTHAHLASCRPPDDGDHATLSSLPDSASTVSTVPSRACSPANRPAPAPLTLAPASAPPTTTRHVSFPDNLAPGASPPPLPRAGPSTPPAKLPARSRHARTASHPTNGTATPNSSASPSPSRSHSRSRSRSRADRRSASLLVSEEQKAGYAAAIASAGAGRYREGAPSPTDTLPPPSSSPMPPMSGAGGNTLPSTGTNTGTPIASASTSTLPQPQTDPLPSPRRSPPFCTRSRSQRKSSRHAEPAPVLRTQPYGAPYFFPTPASPDAAGYVRSVRAERLALAHGQGVVASTGGGGVRRARSETAGHTPGSPLASAIVLVAEPAGMHAAEAAGAHDGEPVPPARPRPRPPMLRAATTSEAARRHRHSWRLMRRSTGMDDADDADVLGEEGRRVSAGSALEVPGSASASANTSAAESGDDHEKRSRARSFFHRKAKAA